MTENDTFNALRKWTFADADRYWDELRDAKEVNEEADRLRSLGLCHNCVDISSFTEKFRSVTGWEAEIFFNEWKKRNDSR